MASMTRLAAAVLVWLAATPVAAAQQASQSGTIVGFVADSINRRPLANAFIALEGTGLGAPSDTAGAFVLSEVPAGSYRAAVMHELLDVLHMAVRTSEFRVAAGDTVRLFLGIPSAGTVIRRRCDLATGEADTAALFGVVTAADGSPAGGATVLLRWRQVLIASDLRFQEREQFRAAVTLPDGTYHVCGLPDDLAAEVRVTRGADTSGTVPVRIPLTGVAVVQLGLPEPADASGASAAVRGRVLDRNGRPVAGAQIVIGEGGGGTADTAGTYAVTGLRAGSQTLIIRRLGYEMREIPLLLRRGELREMDVVLDDFVPLMEEVIVRARRDAALERVGFAVRQRSGNGFHVTPEQISRSSASRVSDLLMEAPMLNVTGSGSNRRVMGRRGTGSGCVNYFIDGRLSNDSPDLIVNPQEVAAIEAYPRGLAPALFLGVSDCEVVLIWTKAHLRL